LSVLALLAGRGRLFSRGPSQLLRGATINGLPGFVTILTDCSENRQSPVICPI